MKIKPKIVIQKYGGSSVATVEKIENVASRICSYKGKGRRIVVVVSAMGDTTDELLVLAGKINPSPDERELDMLISTGEQISCSLLAMALHKRGAEAVSFTGPQVGIITDKFHTKARIQKINTRRIKQALSENKVDIIVR